MCQIFDHKSEKVTLYNLNDIFKRKNQTILLDNANTILYIINEYLILFVLLFDIFS